MPRPVDARPDGHEVLAGHQVCDLHVEVGGEAHVAVGDDADQLAPAVDHRNAGDLVSVLEREDIAQRGVGADGDGIDHHAAFEALHLAHVLGLVGRFEILVNDAEAAGLRHGDGKPRFGHRVHRGRYDGNGEVDRPRQPRCRRDLGRQHRGGARLHQHVVEGQIFGDDAGRHVPTFRAQADSRGLAAVLNTV